MGGKWAINNIPRSLNCGGVHLDKDLPAIESWNYFMIPMYIGDFRGPLLYNLLS